MTDIPSAQRLQSLARAVAAGRSARSWARMHYTPAELADAWCSLPEFRGLVDAHRLHVADRMIGRLMTRSGRAMDAIYGALRCGATYPVKLRAGRILIDTWLEVSRRFHDWTELIEIKQQLLQMQQEDSAQEYGQYQPHGTRQHQSPSPVSYKP